MRRALAAACLTAAWLLAAAAPAMAGAYDQVLRLYEATGAVPACSFSSRQLSTALGGVDTYGAQYFADFTGAIQTALAERAAGACGPRRSRRRAGAALPTPAIRLPASATSPTDGGFPAPILLMAAVALLAALAAALLALARVGGWDPAWAAHWRHGWAEALYRIEGRLGPRVPSRRGRRPA